MSGIGADTPEGWAEYTKGACTAMDYNGIGTVAGFGGGMPFSELPVGFGMSLLMNEPAMMGYAGLTEAQKERVILRCKDARTKGQMQEIVDSLVPGADVQGIFEEEKDSFS